MWIDSAEIDIISEWNEYLFTLESEEYVPSWSTGLENVTLLWHLGWYPWQCHQTCRNGETYSLVFDHYINSPEKQLLPLIADMAGSSKSYVIDALHNLLLQKFRVAALFWLAAFYVKGRTLHSLLQLLMKWKKWSRLNEQSLQRIQNCMWTTKYLIK